MKQQVFSINSVAINFAVGKKFKPKEYHLFYDMGAGTTVATVISFETSNDKKAGLKNVVDLEVLGFAVDQHLGGHNIDVKLQSFLAKEFTKMHAGKLSFDIFDNARAMARLLKEANRCKTILSANLQVGASVENLMDGIDFKLSVSRETLEKLSQDLIDRATIPIKNALETANITLDEINSLVLFGGGVRVPAIQQQISDLVGAAKIARNVDGDEAAVFGSVLHAAAVSAQFRLGQTKRIKDLNSVPVQIAHENESKTKHLETILFTTKSTLGSKKLMTFKRVTDFHFDVEYKYQFLTRTEQSKTPVAKVFVKGLDAAMEKYSTNSTKPPKVKVQIGISESGLLHFSDAAAYFELNVEAAVDAPKSTGSIKDKVMNFWKGKKDDVKDDADKEQPKDHNDGSKDEEDAETEDKAVVDVN